ncbi:MAG: hypothetical protein ACLPVY_26610 [Acidimicrobiia bacterium]
MATLHSTIGLLHAGVAEESLRAVYVVARQPPMAPSRWSASLASLTSWSSVAIDRSAMCEAVRRADEGSVWFAPSGAGWWRGHDVDGCDRKPILTGRRT